MDAMKVYFPDVQRSSCNRHPDWRWGRAGWLVENGRYFSRRRDDADTGRAAHYLRALARSRRGDPRADLLQRFPDIHAARQLREGGGATQVVVQARLLARQTPDDIARLTGVPAQVIDAYEALFFHCRDRLDASDWVLVQAVGMRAGAGSEGPDPAVIFKWFAYQGGPVVLEAVQPYLCGGKDLFDPPLDLATPEGRREQAVRLGVAAQLLPAGAATDRKLHKIMLLLLESDRNSVVHHPPVPFLAQHLDSRLQELHESALYEHADEEDRAVSATSADRLQQTG
jgi:hypothetical protein